MPELKGEDLLLYCKSKFPSTKVIVLSMHNEKSIIKHLIEQGADGFIIKSAGKEEILKAIKAVSEGAKYFTDDVMQSLLQNDFKPKMEHCEALSQITEREREIIILIANGLSSKEIGKKLFISPRTAETHRNNILKKLDVNGVAGLVRFAFKNGLIE